MRGGVCDKLLTLMVLVVKKKISEFGRLNSVT